MMKKSVFNKRFALLLLFSVSVWWASLSIRAGAAMGKNGHASAPSKDPAAVETIKQLEQNMRNAMVATSEYESAAYIAPQVVLRKSPVVEAR